LRQARKYGVSCALASQSPKDIDYHGLDQINSFFFGRILSEQSQKVLKNLLGAKMNPDKLDDVLNRITVLNTGQFIGFLPDLKDEPNLPQFKTRYLFSKHNTLTEADLKNILHPEMVDDDSSGNPDDSAGDGQGGGTNPENVEGPIIMDVTEPSPPMIKITTEDTKPSIPTTTGHYRFKQLKEKAMEELLKRTVEYDFFDKIVNIIKIQKFVNLSAYNSAMNGYVKKLMLKLEYEPVFDGVAPNGLIVSIYQQDMASIIIAVLVAENLTKVGLFGAFASNQVKGDIEKILDGACEVFKKVNF
jgi:hypothetical protein